MLGVALTETVTRQGWVLHPFDERSGLADPTERFGNFDGSPSKTENPNERESNHHGYVEEGSDHVVGTQYEEKPAWPGEGQAGLLGAISMMANLRYTAAPRFAWRFAIN
ncbi:hypothetical protein EV561_1763 [Rhizobium sp. BK376]|nr:hypothetical protein EV561_1763 [Rhizobium sp. BK376]